MVERGEVFLLSTSSRSLAESLIESGGKRSAEGAGARSSPTSPALPFLPSSPPFYISAAASLKPGPRLPGSAELGSFTLPTMHTPN